MSETDMVAFIGDEYKLFCQQAMLDEPFAGVDPIAVEDIQHIV